MSEQLNQLLAPRAAELVNSNFTGVDAGWWWERRLGGGIEICQELDPEAMASELSRKTGRDPAEIRRIVQRELGLEDFDPVVLTFEIPGDATEEEAARLLAGHSATPHGIAEGLYRQIQAAVERS